MASAQTRATASPPYPARRLTAHYHPRLQLLVATLCAAASRPTITYTFREPLVIAEKGKPLCHFLLKIYNEDVRGSPSLTHSLSYAVAHPSFSRRGRWSSGSALCAARGARG